MKVAFTTSDGALIDQNFRESRSFSIWDVGPDESYYVNCVTIKEDADNRDDSIAIRADALCGSTIVCAREINGPAAAKLIARNIHPLKTFVSTPVEEIVTRLRQVLRGTPAPWMRKAAQLRGHRRCNTGLDNTELTSLLNVTVADFLSRYPAAEQLIIGESFALFTSKNSLATGGVMLSVAEALKIRGISSDLFLMYMDDVHRHRSDN